MHEQLTYVILLHKKTSAFDIIIHGQLAHETLLHEELAHVTLL